MPTKSKNSNAHNPKNDNMVLQLGGEVRLDENDMLSKKLRRKVRDMESAIRTIEQDPEQTFIFKVREPYPPSTTPVSELESIALTDLRKNTHHRGKILWLARPESATLRSPIAMMIVVTDVASFESELVEIPLGDVSTAAIGVGYPSNPLAIKEPYLTTSDVNGATVLRVDHLSDIISVSTTDQRLPADFLQVYKNIEQKTAME